MAQNKPSNIEMEKNQKEPVTSAQVPASPTWVVKKNNVMKKLSVFAKLKSGVESKQPKPEVDLSKAKQMLKKSSSNKDSLDNTIALMRNAKKTNDEKEKPKNGKEFGKGRGRNVLPPKQPPSAQKRGAKPDLLQARAMLRKRNEKPKKVELKKEEKDADTRDQKVTVAKRKKEKEKETTIETKKEDPVPEVDHTEKVKDEEEIVVVEKTNEPVIEETTPVIEKNEKTEEVECLEEPNHEKLKEIEPVEPLINVEEIAEQETSVEVVDEEPIEEDKMLMEVEDEDPHSNADINDLLKILEEPVCDVSDVEESINDDRIQIEEKVEDESFQIEVKMKVEKLMMAAEYEDTPDTTDELADEDLLTLSMISAEYRDIPDYVKFQFIFDRKMSDVDRDFISRGKTFHARKARRHRLRRWQEDMAQSGLIAVIDAMRSNHEHLNERFTRFMRNHGVILEISKDEC